jgi:predicted DCC family thiol-disulfide oxidoreductase YuxK
MREPQTTTLTILYDENCALCRRCRDWLAGQPSHVEIELLAAGSPAARSRYGRVPWLGEELVVVDQEGRAWIGPAAFLICLWATVRYRPWSFRLSGPTFAPLAERFFHIVSSRRARFSHPDDSWCDNPGAC